MKRRGFLGALGAAIAGATLEPLPTLDLWRGLSPVVPVLPVPQVLGAGQTGSTLITKGWPVPAYPFMEIKIGNFFSVNPQSRRAAGHQRMVVTSVTEQADGTTLLGIWPSIIPTGYYQNCSESPANGALIIDMAPGSKVIAECALEFA